MMLTRSTIPLLAVLAVATAAHSETVFLWPDGTGTYPTIAEAVASVPDGSTIYLLSGTYTGPGSRDVTLSGKNVSLRAFGGDVVIDCQGQGRALHLLAGVDASTVIEGIEFRNGAAGEGFGGGAICCENAGPTVSNCTFEGNWATYGGAIRAQGAPPPVIEYCLFAGNSGVYGGSVNASDADLHIECTTFARNSASHGGALALVGCDPELVRCTLCRNTASLGSAIEMTACEAKIDRCIVAYNLQNEALVGEEDSETWHSCVYGNADGDDVGGDAHDNYVGDPRFCGVESDDYHLCLNSYCLPSGNPWGCHIGHQAQGCDDCDTPVGNVSWSTIKARYR